MNHIRSSTGHRHAKPVSKFEQALMRSVLICLLLMFPSGCSTLKLDEYSRVDLQTSNTSRAQTNEDITVSADLLLQSERVRKHFGSDLLKKGILPVFVDVANNGNQIVLVEETSFGLQVASHESRGMEAGEVKDDSAAVAVGTAGALLLSPAMMLVGGKMMSDASVINYNFNHNRFPTSTLSPGSRAAGFMYFQLDTQSLKSSDLMIKAALQAMPDGRILKFEF